MGSGAGGRREYVLNFRGVQFISLHPHRTSSLDRNSWSMFASAEYRQQRGAQEKCEGCGKNFEFGKYEERNFEDQAYTSPHEEATVQLYPNLTFDGRCEAAFKFYEKCLHGKTP